MKNYSGKKSMVVILSVISTITALTYLLSMLARGYQPDFGNGFRLKATGILSATSKPKSASVYINRQLVTVTDDSVNLIPGNYDVVLEKEGYLPWKKSYQVEKEFVYITDALLFKSNPVVKTISTEAIRKIKISPDFSKIVFADTTGLYVIENYKDLFGPYKLTPRLIMAATPQIDWTAFNFLFSSNSKQILATHTKKNLTYLINLDQPNNNLPVNIYPKLESQIQGFVATTSSQTVLSEIDNLSLYQKDENYYVSDPVKNKNYLIGPKSKIPSPFWLPGTNYLIYWSPKDVFSIESDGNNLQTIYSSPRSIIDVFPSPDGTKLNLISPQASNSATFEINQITIR